ncbi:MAG: lactonase family protein [Deltaproteobacteria bacterium]|nr:lactonase family protein [Deltaproteobacteria bacterium]
MKRAIGIGVVVALAGLAVCCGSSTSDPDAEGFDAPGRDAPGLDTTSAIDSPSVADVPTTNDVELAFPDAPLSRVTRIYAGQDDQQLVVFALDDADGSLVEIGRTRIEGSTSFVAIDPSGTRGAAVLEGDDQVVGLSFARGSGLASEVGSRRDSRGGGPTHVSIDRSGSFALVANYGGGTVASYTLASDGSLSDSVDDDAPGDNAHQIVTSPSNRWALVPCLGSDRLRVLAFDPATGRFGASRDHDTEADAGPRHFVVTADGAHVYLANELDSTLSVLAFDEATGALTHVQTLSTLPSSFSSRNSVAEIAFGADERFVYVSNRGHDSIAVFAITPDHTVEARGHTLLEAGRPRSFAIDPRGRWLLAGSQDDDVIVRLRIEDDGSLTRVGAAPTTGSPTFVGAFAIPSE